MRILVVEDEPKTGNYLKQGLTEASFVVDLVRKQLEQALNLMGCEVPEKM